MFDNKELARIWALYLGSKCETSPYNKFEDWVGGWVISEIALNKLVNPKLLLYSVEDIKDEECIEIAKMSGVRYTNEDDLKITGKRIAQNIESVYVDEPFLENYINIIDYLRLNSYMLPYNGKNLFEVGVAKRITKS
jgi:hypothetical protein